MLACLTLFQNGTKEVNIRARGMAISRAVDVAQIVTNRFVPDAKVTGIRTGTEQVENQQAGGTSDVSSIEISLTRE